MAHRGVASGDGRNAGIIEFFRPTPINREALLDRLAKISREARSAGLKSLIDRQIQNITDGHIAPDPPLSQSVKDVADPWFGLGAHPDIIEAMWKLDASLPQRCRWVFWGGPSLVHPDTGVVFARGLGTIGFVLRLPPQVLAHIDPQLAKIVVSTGPGRIFDISPAGAEWRIAALHGPLAEWVRAAYEFAGDVRR